MHDCDLPSGKAVKKGRFSDIGTSNDRDLERLLRHAEEVLTTEVTEGTVFLVKCLFSECESGGSTLFYYRTPKCLLSHSFNLCPELEELVIDVLVAAVDVVKSADVG